MYWNQNCSSTMRKTPLRDFAAVSLLIHPLIRRHTSFEVVVVVQASSSRFKRVLLTISDTERQFWCVAVCCRFTSESFSEKSASMGDVATKRQRLSLLHPSHCKKNECRFEYIRYRIAALPAVFANALPTYFRDKRWNRIYWWIRDETTVSLIFGGIFIVKAESCGFSYRIRTAALWWAVLCCWLVLTSSAT